MSKMMHVCLITSARVFERAYGGEERFTVSLANWLAGKGYEVTVMGSSLASIKTRHLINDKLAVKTSISSQEKAKTIQVPYFVYLVSRSLISLFWILKLLYINLRYPVTLIHAQDTGYSGLAAVILGKILKIPVIISSHGIRHKTIELGIHGRFSKILLKIEYMIDLFTIRNADGLIAVNPSIIRYFKRRAVLKSFEFIPIPINLKDFQFSQTKRNSLRKELGIQENAKVVGYVGRFSPEKNLLTLLVSFAKVAQDNVLMKLVLVGQGPQETSLKEYVNKNGIKDKVIFGGVRYDIDKVLSAFDIFVLPSQIEGLSTALLEAMASGRAIICSNISANQELVKHNQEALLVNPQSSEELKRAIELLSTDDLLGSNLSRNASVKAKLYDENIVFPKVVHYYEVVSAGRIKSKHEVL